MAGFHQHQQEKTNLDFSEGLEGQMSGSWCWADKIMFKPSTNPSGFLKLKFNNIGITQIHPDSFNLEEIQWKDHCFIWICHISEWILYCLSVNPDCSQAWIIFKNCLYESCVVRYAFRGTLHSLFYLSWRTQLVLLVYVTLLVNTPTKNHV